MLCGTYTHAQNVFTIATGTNVVTSGAVNIVYGGGTMTNNGTYNDASGTLVFTGATTYAGTGTTSLNNLTVNHASGTSVFNVAVPVTNTVTVSNGTLNANSNITLKSTASATARIAAGATGGGYITGTVNTERYIPGGRRAFRFLGHPFSSALSMSDLTDDIDITGSGGSPFTTTGSNNPSRPQATTRAGQHTLQAAAGLPARPCVCWYAALKAKD